MIKLHLAILRGSFPRAITCGKSTDTLSWEIIFTKPFKDLTA